MGCLRQRKRAGLLAKATVGACESNRGCFAKAAAGARESKSELGRACASRFRIHSYPWSLSQAVQLAFAFTSSHSRFRKQPRSLWQAPQLAFAVTCIDGRFRKAAPVAFASIHGCFHWHFRSLSQAFAVAFASSPARFCFHKQSSSLSLSSQAVPVTYKATGAACESGCGCSLVKAKASWTARESKLSCMRKRP